MLGIAQEQWLMNTIRTSAQAGVVWSLIGQQVMFSPLTPPGRFVQIPDSWDGYQAERGRVRDFFGTMKNCVLLGGDMHSSWAFEVPPNPWSGYEARTGAGSVAVEFIAPAISSAGFFTEAQTRSVVPQLLQSLPHLKYLEGTSRGYLLLDLTRERLQASFHYVADVTRRSRATFVGQTFVIPAGTSHLVRA
jgi:alkaline phosphatase D